MYISYIHMNPHEASAASRRRGVPLGGSPLPASPAHSFAASSSSSSLALTAHFVNSSPSCFQASLSWACSLQSSGPCVPWIAALKR